MVHGIIVSPTYSCLVILHPTSDRCDLFCFAGPLPFLPIYVLYLLPSFPLSLPHIPSLQGASSTPSSRPFLRPPPLRFTPTSRQRFSSSLNVSRSPQFTPNFLLPQRALSLFSCPVPLTHRGHSETVRCPPKLPSWRSFQACQLFSFRFVVFHVYNTREG